MPASFSTTNALLNNATPDNTLAENRVVCLMAPTASGKTALAYELYDSGHYELISVDSALIYRDMSIGTAKPTTAELQRYPHHLVDIIDPTQSYSVAEFVQDVRKLIESCHKRGKIPLLVGGTMMYYSALIEGISDVPDSDEKVRAQVEQWRQTQGIEALYAYLAKIDPETHKRLNAADTQRVSRAIEVYQQTNTALSIWQRKPKQALAHNPNQQWQILSVMPDRAWLHERIAHRLDIMWDEGLVAEVIELLEHYSLTPNMPSMRCVGYRQVLEYLVAIRHPVFTKPHLHKDQFYAAFDQSTTAQTLIEKDSFGMTSTLPNADSLDEKHAYKEMQNKSLFATRQLAKRQYTWLRKLSKTPQSSQSFQSLDLPTNSSLHSTHQVEFDQYQNINLSFSTMEQARQYLLR